MRRATVILWLMLALLPLRGWAVASMGLPAAGGSVALAAPAAMPCHQAVDEAEASGSAAASHCQACDWCHAALGLAAPVVMAGSAAPAVQPAPALVRDTGRPAVGGLDRPPRPLLA